MPNKVSRGYDPDKDDPISRALASSKAYLAGLDERGATPRDLTPSRPKPKPPSTYDTGPGGQNPTTEEATSLAGHFARRNIGIAKRTRYIRD